MAKNDDLKELGDEFHAWKLAQQLRQAEKIGQWKTCTLAWSIITGFVGLISALCVKFSDAVYAGLKAFWLVILEKVQ